MKQSITKKEIDFINDSRVAIAEKTSALTKLTLYLLLAIVTAGIFWSYTSVITVSTTVFGKVVSTSNLQVVQHLEGGIVKDILVKEGQTVKQNQILITLDNTAFSANYNRDLTKQALLRFDIARLLAKEGVQKELIFDPELEKNFPDLANDTRTHFKKDMEEINDSMAYLKNSHDLLQKELDIVGPLSDKGAMSQLDKIRLQRELSRLETEIHEKLKIVREEARKERNQYQADLRVLNEQISTSKDRLNRTEIRSPSDGIVNRLSVSNTGAVISPGSKIAEIVPIDNELTILVKVPTDEIGFIKIDQTASVKINAFDYSIYGDLRGKVVGIGADSLTDTDGRDYYEVKLKTDKNYLGTDKKPLEIRPGMSVTVNIVTGKRTIFSYLLKPLVDLEASRAGQ